MMKMMFCEEMDFGFVVVMGWKGGGWWRLV